MNAGKTARKIAFTDEEKQKITSMASPSEMERSERKRQYSALRRAIHRAANPALTAKFSLCNDTERFAMLKQWVVNPDTSSIEIEERYVSWVEELRTDRYVSVSWPSIDASIFYICFV